MKNSNSGISTLQMILFLGSFLMVSCTGKSRVIAPSSGFGAYYTHIHSDRDFEKYSRTGDYADIIVDLGEENGKLVFWRGSSYLPYLETPAGKKDYFDEIVPRAGDGEGMMPDRTNTYSRVAIVENSPDRVLIHWRYLSRFSGTNPHLEVSTMDFVDEYFTITPEGSVTRTVRKGSERIDEWNDPLHITTQVCAITNRGIKVRSLSGPEKSQTAEAVEGNPPVSETVAEPVAWFRFDEASGDETAESISGTKSMITGNKALWKKGISGTALQFDGYTTTISLPADKAPQPSEALTIEGWASIAAYPWSWCPMIQQADDTPEKVRMLRGEYDLTDPDTEYEGPVYGDEGYVQLTTEFQNEDDRGYFLGIDGHGYPAFKLRVGGSWEEIISDVRLERNTWYHLAASYDNSTGKICLYVNGIKTAEKTVSKAGIELSTKDLQIGRGKDRRPVDAVHPVQSKGTYSFDGMLDEIRIYDLALSPQQISQSYSNYPAEMSPDMEKRKLPEGEKRGEFGAYYTNLKFYESWDNLWRFGPHPDVVVEFENNPGKFVFWKGVSYIPMIVNEKEQWYSNEFNETWSTSGGTGCQEPMSDKGSRYNYAHIIENTPARAVVHWRFPLVDVHQIRANYVEETGWYDVADWYYYIYPDGVAVKLQHLWTSGERNHEWQESMAIFGPDQHPHDIIERDPALTMMTLDGTYHDYGWKHAPPENIEKPGNSCIQVINYTGDFDPVTIGDPFEWTNVYGGDLTPYAVFCTWNHWPVAQMPSDGRYAMFSNRTAHSSLTHLGQPVYDEGNGDKPFYEKILMEGMLDEDRGDLVTLAKSWLKAPGLSNLRGGSGAYDKTQRAYVLDVTDLPLSFTVDASTEQPVRNLCLVLKNLDHESEVSIDGNVLEQKNMVRKGLARDTDGNLQLIVWITTERHSSFEISVDDLTPDP